MSKKEKLLAAAQKNLLKGQLAKAIKDYQKVIEGSPNDVRNRQKLGELYSRAGMMAEALETYESVARHYAKNGFYLKAIAVYKQMQKVDSSQSQIYYKLAELNEKQGLLGNAQAEYRQLVKLLRNQNKDDEVIKVLEKMKDIDPDNMQLRLELVEGYARHPEGNRVQEALGQALEHLEEKVDLACPPLLQQAVEKYCPDSADLKIGLAKVLLDRGDAPTSVDLLQNVISGDPENRDALLILADGFHQLGEFSREQELCGQYLEKFPQDLDVREKSVRAKLAGGEAALALEEMEDRKDAFFEDQRLAFLKEIYEQFKIELPDNEAVHQTLHAVYENTGEGGKLFDLMSNGEKEAEEDPTEKAREPEVPEEGAVGPETYGELPEDFFERTEDPESSAADEQELAEETSPSVQEEQAPEDSDNLEFEIEVEINEPDLSAEDFEANHLEFDNLDLEEAKEEPSLDLDEIIGGLDDLDVAKEEPAAPVDVAGDLEEAEFYFQQGMTGEAESKCRALLKAVPDCEEARELLERIAPSSGEAGEPPATASPPPVQAAEETVRDREKSRLDGSLSEFKKGLESQIGEEDTETHYNLGIAYKEMGLFDEAVEQFGKAMADPARRVDCLTLKGVCQVQKGEFESAVETLKEGLAMEDLKEEERISFHYELGVLYQTWQRPLEALESYQSVAEAEPFFRDVESKIKALRKELGLDDNGGSENPGGGSKDRISYI